MTSHTSNLGLLADGSDVDARELFGSENLYIEFCGEERVLAKGDSLSFGRSADLVIDSNPYMHRVVGRFRHVRGGWVLQNRSRRQMIELHDVSSPSAVVIAPGRAANVLFGEFACRFSAGPTPYEITGALETFEWESDMFGQAVAGALETIDWGRVELNEDQLLLLLVLCEQYLRDPVNNDAPLIPNKLAAHELGWSLSKFNRKLDHLCEKLQRAGVQGLRGDVGGTAVDRRRRLVDHALTAPLVDLEQLMAWRGL